MADYVGGGPGNDARALAMIFEGAGPALLRDAKPIFKRAAQNLKTQWQDNIRASAFRRRVVDRKTGQVKNLDWQGIARAINYDDHSDGKQIHYELGTDADGSGHLVHLSMGYTSRGGGHRTDPIEWLDDEAQAIGSELTNVLQNMFKK